MYAAINVATTRPRPRASPQSLIPSPWHIMSNTIQGPNWECINKAAAWQPRDSQGEVIYDGHLWIFGGWFTPQTPNPFILHRMVSQMALRRFADYSQ